MNKSEMTEEQVMELRNTIVEIKEQAEKMLVIFDKFDEIEYVSYHCGRTSSAVRKVNKLLKEE